MDSPRRHRACNACRSRKVRCNPSDQHRCRECEHQNLRCEYPESAPRTKRSNRGTVIQGHKLDRNYVDGAALRPLQPNGLLPDSAGIASPSATLQLADEDVDFYHALLHDYETCVFPFFPVITESEAREAIAAMHRDREARAFVYAMCAVTVSLAHSLTAPEVDEAQAILSWLSRSMAALPGVLSIEDISVRRVVLMQFIHTSLAGLGRFEPAYHYLRQSISMVEALKLGEVGIVEALPPPERARRQRLYYLIFIHERYFALFHHHRISMAAVDWLPEADSTLPHQIFRGFNQIIRLFRHIDMAMIEAWMAVTDDTATVDPDWIQKKHRELEDEPAGSTELAGLWPMQQADLIITKHWMRMLLWQIALSRHMLSSGSGEQAMSLLFPVGVSTQLRALIGQVSRQEISIHGSGIQQKLFELTDIIASVVLTVPNADPSETTQRIDDFRFLFEFWRTLPRLNATHLAILQDKDEKIKKLTI